MKCRIEVSGLSKVYGDGEAARKVLDDVSFTISHGERIGIVGPNGAGKSTLLGVLAGIHIPTTGSVNVVGNVHAALTLGLGMREELTGRENLYIDAEVRGHSRRSAEPIIEEMIRFADIGPFIDRPMRTYSSGMKSRVAFASLVFVDPEILLIDETLSAGDRWFGEKAAKAISNLCNRGQIVILVSHSLGTIVDICSRCLWLDKGRLIADGAPAVVTQSYRESIMSSEESMTVRELGGDSSSWYFDPSVRIDHLAIVDGKSGSSMKVVDSEANVRIRGSIFVGKEISELMVRLFIERGDGLRVGESRFEAAVSRGTQVVEAQTSPIGLRPGLYRVDMEVFVNDKVCARSGQVFKVISASTVFGGNPALRHPIIVHGCESTRNSLDKHQRSSAAVLAESE